MGLFSRTRSGEAPDLEALLDGRLRRDEADHGLAELIRTVELAFEQRPDPETESRHLAAIAGAAAHPRTESTPAARPQRVPAERKWRTALARNRQVMRAGKLMAGVLALCVATAGLAVAGVTLPGPARDVAAALGLPNQQAEENAKADEALEQAPGQEIRSTRQSERGGNGDSASEGKRGGGVSTQQHDGEDHGIGGDVSEDAQGQRERTVEQRKEFGQRTRQRAHDLAEEHSGGRLPDQSESGPPSGLTQPQGGAQTGEEMSQDGRTFGEGVAGGQRP